MHGYKVIPEAATDVIAYEQSLGVLEPWTDPNFIDKIIHLQKQRYMQNAHGAEKVQFYDRSLFCTYALTLYLGFKVTQSLKDELHQIQDQNFYEKRVFFIENLGFIEKTNARQISYKDSVVFEKVHLDVYKHFGYECVGIPPMTLLKRKDILLRFI